MGWKDRAQPVQSDWKSRATPIEGPGIIDQAKNAIENATGGFLNFKGGPQKEPVDVGVGDNPLIAWSSPAGMALASAAGKVLRPAGNAATALAEKFVESKLPAAAEKLLNVPGKGALSLGINTAGEVAGGVRGAQGLLGRGLEALPDRLGPVGESVPGLLSKLKPAANDAATAATGTMGLLELLRKKK